MSDEDYAASALAGLSHTVGDSESASSKPKTKKKLGRRPKQPEPTFPVAPRVVQIVKKPKTYMDHSYRDFSSVPADMNYSEPSCIHDMSFSQKVHHILSQEEYSAWISWSPHGRCFKILVPKRLEQAGVLQKYFGHSRYSSFLRQLSNHGFKHLSQGRDRNSYYHEFMLRGLPHLTSYMPEPKDARRLLPDPENEPDFYKLSELYPLSGEGPVGAAIEKHIPVSTAVPSKNSRLASEVHALVEARPSKMGKTIPPHVASLGLEQVRASMVGHQAGLLNTAAAQAHLELQAHLVAQQQAWQTFALPRQNNNVSALAELLRLRAGSYV